MDFSPQKFAAQIGALALTWQAGAFSADFAGYF
jgi:hypothetical protein